MAVRRGSEPDPLSAYQRAGKARQRHLDQQPLTFCQHPGSILGAVRTATGWQLFDVCNNPSCSEVLGGPYPYDGPLTSGTYRFGDTSRRPDVCGFYRCHGQPVEMHHWAPTYLFGAAAEHYPVGPLCEGHHEHWHRTIEQLRRTG